MDGKVLRGSRDGSGSGSGSGSGAGTASRARSVVNLWLADHGLVLAQRKIPEDCREITQAPLLLRHIALKNTVVTADAAHAQTDTATEILSLSGDYLLCIKGNQAATREAILTALEPAIAALPDDHFHSVDKWRRAAPGFAPIFRTSVRAPLERAGRGGRGGEPL